MLDDARREGDAPIPEGFILYDRGRPSWGEALGPTYLKPVGEHGRIVALRVDARHLNVGGVAHGGMLTTLADSAMGINLALAKRARTGSSSAQVTVSLTADFIASAQPGDWLEAHVHITRLGQRLAYVGCDLRVGTAQVLRASAVFAFLNKPLPAGLVPPAG